MNQGQAHVLTRLYAAVVAAFLCLEVFCASVSLAWDANSEPDVAGYRICYSRLPGGSETVDVGMETSVTITDLVAGSLYRFYATTYNSDGLESAPSSIVEYLVPGAPEPTELGPVQITNIAMNENGLAITFPTASGILYIVEADDDFPSDNWNIVASGIIGTGLPMSITDSLWNSAPRRVYRIAATPSL